MKYEVKDPFKDNAKKCYPSGKHSGGGQGNDAMPDGSQTANGSDPNFSPRGAPYHGDTQFKGTEHAAPKSGGK